MNDKIRRIICNFLYLQFNFKNFTRIIIYYERKYYFFILDVSIADIFTRSRSLFINFEKFPCSIFAL